jgi:hypothetical protein
MGDAKSCGAAAAMPARRATVARRLAVQVLRTSRGFGAGRRAHPADWRSQRAEGLQTSTGQLSSMLVAKRRLRSRAGTAARSTRRTDSASSSALALPARPGLRAARSTPKILTAIPSFAPACGTPFEISAAAAAVIATSSPSSSQRHFASEARVQHERGRRIPLWNGTFSSEAHKIMPARRCIPPVSRGLAALRCASIHFKLA